MTDDKTVLKESTKITLKRFIDDNHKLLTIIGVFTALTAFFSSKRDFGIFASFFSFIMLLLLYWELWVNFPKSEESSTNLQVFEYFFMLLLFALAGEFLIFYKDILLTYSNLMIFVALLYAYSVIFIKIINKYKLYLVVRNFAERNERWSPLIRSLAFILTLGIICLLTLFTWNEFFKETYLYIVENFVNRSILYSK